MAPQFNKGFEMGCRLQGLPALIPSGSETLRVGDLSLNPSWGDEGNFCLHATTVAITRKLTFLSDPQVGIFFFLEQSYRSNSSTAWLGVKTLIPKVLKIFSTLKSFTFPVTKHFTFALKAEPRINLSS